ncbi:hypothetical protein FKP32DRAFT_1601959, partial [Trametes sanguinea]
MKVHWFRQNALRARWQEEVYLRREEMYRTLAFFRHEEQRWKTRADRLAAQGESGAAAAARSSEGSGIAGNVSPPARRRNFRRRYGRRIRRFWARLEREGKGANVLNFMLPSKLRGDLVDSMLTTVAGGRNRDLVICMKEERVRDLFMGQTWEGFNAQMKHRQAFLTMDGTGVEMNRRARILIAEPKTVRFSGRGGRMTREKLPRRARDVYAVLSAVASREALEAIRATLGSAGYTARYLSITSTG